MNSDDYDIPILCDLELGTVWGFGEEIDLKDPDNISWYETKKDDAGKVKEVIKHDIKELHDFVKCAQRKTREDMRWKY